jgi:hypothetical protein
MSSKPKSIAAGAGHHRAHELFVARHVDETDTAAVFQRHPGVTEFDGDAAPLFFRQPVGVDARQRAHERRLTVVDVACSADDHVASPMMARRRPAS